MIRHGRLIVEVNRTPILNERDSLIFNNSILYLFDEYLPSLAEPYVD